MKTCVRVWQYLSLFRMRNVSDMICRESHNIHFMLNFFSENPAVYEKMWQTALQPNSSQLTIRRLHFACWIT
jgi:hypothetical protein